MRELLMLVTRVTNERTIDIRLNANPADLEAKRSFTRLFCWFSMFSLLYYRPRQPSRSYMQAYRQYMSDRRKQSRTKQ